MDAASLPGADDIDALKAALDIARARALAAQAELAAERAGRSADQALIAHLKLEIQKLTRARFGPSSERTARLLDQMELQLEELEAAATEDDLAAERAAAATTAVAGFTRRKPSRKPFPEHLPRERVVEPAPTACACCGGTRLAKLGEDVTETLEVIPRRWKVIQRVREKFTCRDCETVSQPPAPFHVIARGWAGPSLLASSGSPSDRWRASPQPLRKVRPASAAEPPGRALRQGGCALEPLHPGRPGGRVRRRADASLRRDPSPCADRRSPARR